MKRIIKNSEPQYFKDWKDSFLRDNGRPAIYKDFRCTEEWARLRQDLLAEQGNICCYCMKAIDNYDSHIEHFIPRNLGKTSPHSVRANEVELRYDNLFLSCNGSPKDNHCGRYKDREDTPMLLSPATPDVEERFTYDIVTGAIQGEDASAMTTIRVLNLDNYTLRRHRKSAFYQCGIFDDDFEEQREALLNLYTNRDSDGAFVPFCAAIVWAIQQQ